MKFDDLLKRELAKYAPGRVKYVKGWRTRNTGQWRVTTNGRTKNIGVPKMVIHHHTAGAATESTNPEHKGNQPGANNGVVQYCVAKNNSVPYCNAVVDRDGTIYITAAYPVWHAGRGSFKGTEWARHGIDDDTANTSTFGVEVVSRGRKRDFTRQQKIALRRLDCALRAAAGWKGFKYRIANHKDWAPTRKVDTKYRWQYFRSGAVKAWQSLT